MKAYRGDGYGWGERRTFGVEPLSECKTIRFSLNALFIVNGGPSERRNDISSKVEKSKQISKSDGTNEFRFACRRSFFVTV